MSRLKSTAISMALKMIIFRWKNCDIFLIFAQNADCGYSLGPPELGVLMSTNNLCFRPFALADLISPFYICYQDTKCYTTYIKAENSQGPDQHRQKAGFLSSQGLVRCLPLKN